MAELGATIKLGESIAAMLRIKRDLAAASGALAPVPANLEISQTTIGKLTGNPAPTGGLGLICCDILRSDHVAPRITNSALPPRPELALEMLFLLVAWSGKAEEEQAALAWAMLELDAYPTLDASVLKGDVWEQGETIQLAPEPFEMGDQFRFWDALGHRHHMAQAYRARVLRLRMAGSDDSLPVVASRFEFADSVEREAE